MPLVESSPVRQMVRTLCRRRSRSRRVDFIKERCRRGGESSTRHPSLSEYFSTSHSFNTLPNHTHSFLIMYASTFAFGALQLLVLAASALPTCLTSRDDYYGDVRRVASLHEYFPVTDTRLSLLCRRRITLLERVLVGTPTTTASPL